jgi:hypothetical protein
LEDASTYLSCFSHSDTKINTDREVDYLSLTTNKANFWDRGRKTNIFPFSRLLIQRPNLTITISPQSLPWTDNSSWTAPLAFLLNHRNDLWLHHLGQNHFAEVSIEVFAYTLTIGKPCDFLCLFLRLDDAKARSNYGRAWVKEMGLEREDVLVERVFGDVSLTVLGLKNVFAYQSGEGKILERRYNTKLCIIFYIH